MKIVMTRKNRLIMRLALAAVLLSFALALSWLSPGAHAYATDEGLQTDAAQVAAEAQAEESSDSATDPETELEEEVVFTAAPAEETVADEAVYAAAPAEDTAEEEVVYAAAPAEETVADDAALTAAPAEEEVVVTAAPAEETVADDAALTAAPAEEDAEEEVVVTAAPEEETVADDAAMTATPAEEPATTAPAEEPATTAPAEEAATTAPAEEAQATATPAEEAVADRPALSNSNSTPTTAPANDADADEEDAEEAAPSWVYVDGQNGSDDNDGSSADQAVKTWSKATEILGDTGEGIYVSGTVDASGTISTPNGQTVKRAEGFTGTMFNISGSASFKDIVLDGENNTVNSSAIILQSGATVNFYKGAVLQNFSKSGYGAVIYAYGSGKILIDGAEFYDNEATYDGGVIYASSSNLNVVIRSGRLERNSARSGGVYHNRSTGASNLLEIYNAVIFDNENGNSDTAALMVCGMNSTDIEVMSVDGGAVFDNDRGENGGYDIGVGNNGSDDTQNHMDDVFDDMLGGGMHNWEVLSSGTNGTKKDRMNSDPSYTDITKAIEAAVTIIKDNVSKGIYTYQASVATTNGVIRLGRAQAALEVRKVDSKTGKAIEGVEFVLSGTTVEPAGNAVTKNAVTSDNGTFTINNISPGEYTLTETTPAGYKKVDTTWTVTVDTMGKLTMTDADGNVMTRDASTNYYYVIENEPIEVQVSKTDINGAEIEGAKLEITDSEGNVVAEWVSVADETKVVNLAAGEYTLHESATPSNNYVLASDIKFIVDEYGKVSVDGSDVEKVTMVNVYKTTTVKISKVVLGQGDELPGATLTVTGTRFDGTEIDTIEWVTGDTPREFELPAGEYVLTETSCPKGYLVAESISFTVTEDGKVMVGDTEAEDATVVMEDAQEEVVEEVKGLKIKPVNPPKGSSSVFGDYRDKTVDTKTADTKTADNGNTVKTDSPNGGNAASSNGVNTGDNNLLAEMIAMMAAAAAALFAMIRRRRSETE